MNSVMILGGYGNFGKIIAQQLSKARVPIIILGRDREKTIRLSLELNAQAVICDISKDFEEKLVTLEPKIVINTCGPFQNADYSIPKICIQNKVHYIDLADSRNFVCNIPALNALATKNNVLVVSGASSVPGLSSAVLEEFKNEFSEIDSLVYGISPGQKTARGLATVQSVLSYVGKPLKYIKDTDKLKKRYGWQDLYCQQYPILGKRWMANCDIPDLDLFPQRYNIKHMQFSAGIESTTLHLSMWALSWLIRLGLALKLENHAKGLLKLSHYFDRFGTANGGMHVHIKGKNKNGNPYERLWFIIAKNGDGLQIPCVPAILITKKLLSGELTQKGAQTCVGMISLKEYMAELKEFQISHMQYCVPNGEDPKSLQ